MQAQAMAQFLRETMDITWVLQKALAVKHVRPERIVDLQICTIQELKINHALYMEVIAVTGDQVNIHLLLCM